MKPEGGGPPPPITMPRVIVMSGDETETIVSVGSAVGSAMVREFFPRNHSLIFFHISPEPLYVPRLYVIRSVSPPDKTFHLVGPNEAPDVRDSVRCLSGWGRS